MRGPRLIAGPFAFCPPISGVLFEQEQFTDPEAANGVKPELVALSNFATARDVVAGCKTIEELVPKIFSLVVAIADDPGLSLAGARHFQKVGGSGALGDDLDLGADRQLAQVDFFLPSRFCFPISLENRDVNRCHECLARRIRRDPKLLAS